MFAMNASCAPKPLLHNKSLSFASTAVFCEMSISRSTNLDRV
uniref:Uncharacterized protein n=1 Tax=Anguilla anguilla TaxID=7936 RepID=A0A0E9RA15_ANGAN